MSPKKTLSSSEVCIFFWDTSCFTISDAYKPNCSSPQAQHLNTSLGWGCSGGGLPSPTHRASSAGLWAAVVHAFSQTHPGLRGFLSTSDLKQMCLYLCLNLWNWRFCSKQSGHFPSWLSPSGICFLTGFSMSQPFWPQAEFPLKDGKHTCDTMSPAAALVVGCIQCQDLPLTSWWSQDPSLGDGILTSPSPPILHQEADLMGASTGSQEIGRELALPSHPHLGCLQTHQHQATLWTADRQAPLSIGLSRQEYWSELPFPSPGDLPNPGVEPMSPALAGRVFTLSHWGSTYPFYMMVDPRLWGLKLMQFVLPF